MTSTTAVPAAVPAAVLALAALLAGTAQTSSAHAATERPAGSHARPTCALLDRATSANEDFAEAALTRDRTAVADAQHAIHTTFHQIRPSLGPDAAARARRLIAVVDRATAAGRLPRAAEAAIGVYRVLIDDLSTRLPTTLDVATLDYTGYKIQTQAAAGHRNWVRIGRTVTLAATETATVLQRLPLPDNKALVDLAAHSQDGIEAALEAKDAEWITAAAQIQLDTVDFLEAVIKNPSPAAC
jgi:hypothetical protein